MNPLIFLRGETLGKTIYNVLVLIAALGLVGLLGFGLISGKFWHWKADRANARADRAEAVAEVQTVNAANADGSSVNASHTRAAIDSGRIEITLKTEQAATRIENRDPIPVDPSGNLDPDLVRELESARDRAGSAANRLQQSRPR